MGRTHIVSAQVAWMAIAPAYLDDGETWKLVAGIAVAGFAALGPDIDSGGSTICRLLFWLPDGINSILHSLLSVKRRRVGDRIADLAGGHRFGTHSLLSIPFVFWISAILTVQWAGWWLSLAIALGWIAHIVGDCGTEDGVGIGWPWTRRKVRYASLDVGKRLENRLVFPALNVAGVLLAMNIAGIPVVETSRRIFQAVTQ